MIKNQRIVLVDALRGFALLGIVLIHFVEHFDFFYPPETRLFFSAQTDQQVMDVIILLISGKAYSIFAITFGFSFFIQLNRNEQKGVDFRGRFAWRLTILFFLGVIHSLVYRGDILHIYALLGFPLLLLYKLNTKALLIIALLFALEIPIVYHLLMTFINPAYTFTPDWGGTWFADAEKVYANGSFWDVIKINFWKSRYLVYAWTFYTGRAVQLFALFILGLIIGRKRYFENMAKYKPQLVQILIGSVILIAAFHYSSVFVISSNLSDLQKGLLETLLKAFSNLGYTALIVTVFSLIYLSIQKSEVVQALAVYGKMSLTNYVSQAIFGVIFFFGFGFGMWKYMGSTWSLLAGFAFFLLQVLISRYWKKHYYYGPLEWFWRALTYFNFNLKMRR